MTWAVVGKFAKQKEMVKEKHFDPCEVCTSTYPCEETCGGYPRKLMDGEPCGNPDCLSQKYLDDVGCHRNNGEKEYSLVGRLKKLTVPDVGPDKVAEKAGEV